MISCFRAASPRRCGPGLTYESSARAMWGPEMRSGWSRDPIMISPFDMYFASTPVIAMKSTGCLRFPECPRAGEAGQMIFFKGQKAVLWTRANRDVANQDFSDLRPSVQDAECRR